MWLALLEICRAVRKPNMELLFLEAKPIPSHAIIALVAVIIGAIQLISVKASIQIETAKIAFPPHP